MSGHKGQNSSNGSIKISGDHFVHGTKHWNIETTIAKSIYYRAADTSIFSLEQSLAMLILFE